jgi:hypothetical protein
MCTSEDLTFGYGIDDELNKLYHTMPGAFDDDPVAMVAALLTLDEQFNLRQEGDYVLVTPGLMMWLFAMVKPVSEKLKQAIQSEDYEACERLTTSQPFEVCFESPEGAEYTEQYPEIVRGKTVRLRVMSEAQASELTFLYTVRSDGTFIYRPGFESRLAGNTQPRTMQDLPA